VYRRPGSCPSGARENGMSTTITVTCPCCSASLRIDTAAGVVVGHEAPPERREKVDLDQRLAQIKADQARADEKMQEALRREKDRSRLMADKFDQLFKDSAEKDDGTAPVRDIDLD
jgi:hypothetical protein